MLRTARSGRAVRFPAIMRMGENCASCVSVIKSWTEKDCITCILCRSKRGREKIFKHRVHEGKRHRAHREEQGTPRVKERKEKLFNTEVRRKKRRRAHREEQRQPWRAIWSKSSAEVQKKYFRSMKFSTQVLKTLCKRGLAARLTCRSSTL